MSYIEPSPEVLALRKELEEAQAELRMLRLALVHAQRAAEKRQKGALCQVNESIQPVVDAFMAWVCEEERQVSKTRSSLVGAFQRKLDYLKSPELIEELADSEHDRWARWHKHLRKHMDEPGRMERWDRLAETPYAELDDETQEWDRIEARRTRDIFMEYLAGRGSGDPSILKAEPREEPTSRTVLSAEDMEAIDTIVRWRSSASDWYGEELVSLVSDYIYEEEGIHGPESNLASYEESLQENQEGLTEEHLESLRRGLKIMRELPEAEKWQAVMDSLKRIEHY